MNRYLLNFSYLGTNFRGLQKTINNSNPTPPDNTSVQGAIELALANFEPINDIKLILSSRTDAGVHALHSTVHVDLVRKNSKPYNPTTITTGLNRHFFKKGLPIRILNTELVPDTFHARYHVKSRTYLYRFAVSTLPRPKLKEKVLHSDLHTHYVPIEEIDRCFFIRNCSFDIERAQKAASLFKGNHDFRTFMGANPKNPKDHPWFAYRCISHISLVPSTSCVSSFACSKVNEAYNYWDLQVTGRSFLYRQIRRIVGTIIAVAQHKITIKNVYEMLTVPSANSWCSQISTAPPQGLYLCKIEYNNKDKQFN